MLSTQGRDPQQDVTINWLVGTPLLLFEDILCLVSDESVKLAVGIALLKFGEEWYSVVLEDYSGCYFDEPIQKIQPY